MTQSDVLRSIENHGVRITELEARDRNQCSRMDRLEGKMDKLMWLIIAVISEIPVSLVIL